jgi:predicted transcriptional regulator
MARRTTKLLSPVSIRLDPDVRNALDEWAAAEERSLSWYINRVLRQHVDERQRREGKPGKPGKG